LLCLLALPPLCRVQNLVKRAARHGLRTTHGALKRPRSLGGRDHIAAQQLRR